jgi:plastocyanin
MRRLTTRHVAAAGILLMALTQGACTGGSGTAAPATPAAGSPTAAASSGGATGTSVTIKDFAFEPTSITIAPGSTVTWTNQDTVGHTATADDGAFDSRTMGSGATFSETFSSPGTYQYHCTIHPAMKATIVVQ